MDKTLFVFFFFCPFVLIDYKQEFAKKKKKTDQKRTVAEYNHFSYDHIKA